LLVSSGALLQGQTVRFHTNLGDIDVALRADVAPQTVANFQTYISQGTYTATIFHRSVPGFVIQGGGYQLLPSSPNSPQLSPQNAPVPNEFNLSNTRGTIAMALSGTNINSGTDQWFFNLADNSASLDAQKFTVFGKITGCSGLAVMDRIAATPVLNGGAPFDTIPLLNYKTGAVKAENFVQVSSITPTPAGTTPTLVNAASYGCLGVSPGELLTVYGDNIGPAQFTTKTDSNGLVATSLAGTRVLFDGTPGPMLYTSAG
jgi:cyclophilin family peptidyl-prolyl cis-trans isomerase